MHPKSVALIAFCDGEAGADRGRRIAKHLAKCENCRDQARHIRREKDLFAASAAPPAMDTQQGLAEVISAIAAWQHNPTAAAPSQLRSRLRCQIETYLGAPAVLVVDRPGIQVEELLGRASAVLEAFLGPGAAQAVSDDVLGKLHWPRPVEETCP